ncbi:stereocilin [Pelobates fuscus]|uniref:stereocilin n=1 Tax=Pelobates fuscus TaxID=191477 RepID=UPI002FE48C46
MKVTGYNQQRKHSKFENILSVWKSKLGYPLSEVSNFMTVRKAHDDVQTTLDRWMANLESLWNSQERFPSFNSVQKNRVKQNRLSAFLYNISMYLQSQDSQEEDVETWENLVHQFLKVPAVKTPTLPLLNMQDFFVSLRGSQNWAALLTFMQTIIRALSSSHTALRLLGQNWEILSRLMDTLFQALISGTLTQTSTTLQGVLCSLMGHNNCAFGPDQLNKLMFPFEISNWRPLVSFQSGSSVAAHGKYRPFSIPSGVFKDKTGNNSKLNSGLNQAEMQNVLEIFYRSKEREKGMKDSGSEEVVWEVLEDLRQNLMKRMERSVYDTLSRKVSRMTGTLMNRVSSIIGTPHSDQNGKCSIGNLQQLILWGIKHNLTWNIQSFGFTSTTFPSAPPILACSKVTGQNERKTHNITKRSEADFVEEIPPYSEVLEAVCNDTIPGLPGVSNFTVFLYCNVYNDTGYSLESTYDLKTACSDAAWYLSSMEEDSFWVWVCREYFPAEFNITICKNSSFSKLTENPPLISELCHSAYNSSDIVRALRNLRKCSDMWQGLSMNPKGLKTCLLENKTIWMDTLCSNETLSGMSEASRAWVSKLCHRQTSKINMLNSSCNYRKWDESMFRNATMMEECRGINIQEFGDIVCRDSALYSTLRPIHSWVAKYCTEYWTITPEEGKCFLQKIVDMLPLSSNFDVSQLCRSPVSYTIGLVSQLSQCDSESTGWAQNLQYLLKILDFLFTLSDLDQIGKETRDRLGEAILLSSLLDNGSLWASFKMNSTLSILQTVEWYLEQNNDASDKEDLLSCFSPVLWELMQNEENASSFEILLQEYLQMPRGGFQKVLMSAENEAVERFLSLMHRSWPRIQVSLPDEKGLETLTSMMIQKFPRLTPQIFVDLSQFIPFMSVSDIISFPLSLLANQSVLDAIRIHSPDMKITQKRAFARRLLQVDLFGDIPLWPPYFLRSIQPILPYLPICHFVKLTPEQIKLLADGWKDVKLDMVHGRYVAQSLMNRDRDETTEQIQRLGSLICYLTYEDLHSYLQLQYPLGSLEKNLLECISNRTLSPRGRLAYSLVDVLKKVNLHGLGLTEIMSWKRLLSEMGVDFFQKLEGSQLSGLLQKVEAAEISPAQALAVMKYITPKNNVAELVICSFHSLIPVLSPEILRSLSASVLTRACQCLGPSLPLLSAAQKAAIMQNLRQYSYEQERWSVQLACLLPFAPLKLLHLDTQTLLKNISLYGELEWMPQQTQFLWRKIQAGANLTKNTILTLGSLANGIQCDTLQQLNTLSEIRDVVKYLHGIPCGLRKSLRKCILEEIQRRPGLSWEDTAWMGPEFVTDLPVKLIDRLSNDSVKLFLEHAHKYPKVFLELLPHKKAALVEKALRVLQIPEHGEILVEDLELLGPLVGYIGEEHISQINRRHLLLHLDELKTYCFSEEFIGKLGKILTEEDMLGNPLYWTKKDIVHMGRLLFFLPTQYIHSLPKNVLGQDTLEWLLESQRVWEEDEIGRICMKENTSLMDRMRRNRLILTSAITKSIYRGTRVSMVVVSTEPVPSCADMRVTLPSAWSPSQISGMTLPDFEDCLSLISEDMDLTPHQAKAVLAKIKQLFGPIKTISPVQILQMGYLTSYMSEKDLHEIQIPDWGVVSFLGRMESWTVKQMKALVTNILRQNRKGTSDLDLMEISALGHLLCGLGVEELKRINKQEFSQAAVFVGTLKLKCSEAQMETLAELLTSHMGFGTVSRWAPEIFMEVGTLSAGLPDIVLSSLIRDQIQGLTPDAITLIPAPKFSVVFSPAQLSFFTSDQATAVTLEQYHHLSYQQRQAISSAQYEGEIHQDPRGENSVGSIVPSNPAFHLLAALLFLI